MRCAAERAECAAPLSQRPCCAVCWTLGYDFDALCGCVMLFVAAISLCAFGNVRPALLGTWRSGAWSAVRICPYLWFTSSHFSSRPCIDPHLSSKVWQLRLVLSCMLSVGLALKVNKGSLEGLGLTYGASPFVAVWAGPNSHLVPRQLATAVYLAGLYPSSIFEFLHSFFGFK